ATWGTSDAGSVNIPANIGSSTMIFAPLLGGEIDIFAAGTPIEEILSGAYTRSFNISSMDFAHLYSTAYAPVVLGTINLTFNGFGPGTGNALITQSFTIAPPPAGPNGVQNPILQTLTFDSRWHDMSNVWFFQSTSSATASGFTNVVT